MENRRMRNRLLVFVILLMSSVKWSIAAEKYALLIAVAKYDHSSLNDPEPLKYPEEDAKALGALLKTGGYEVDLLLGQEAKRAAILKGLEGLANKADAEGVVLVGMFGHGTEIESLDDQNSPVMDNCFCPFDTGFTTAKDARGNDILDSKKQRETEPDPATLVKLSELMVALNLARASHRVVLADCCRTTANRAKGRSFGAGFRTKDLPTDTSIMFGCSPNERAWEHANWKHGAFTKCLLEGVNELASKGKSVETANLAALLKKRVPQLVATVAPRDRQNPRLFSTDSVDLLLSNIKVDDKPGSLNVPTSSTESLLTAKLAVEDFIDLLPLVKLPNHSVVGKWNRDTDESISCEAMPFSRIIIPVITQGSYQLQCEFTRKSGEECFAVILPVGKRQCTLALGAAAGKVHGIGMVKGVKSDSASERTGAATTPGELENDIAYRCDVEVTITGPKARIKAKLNEAQIIDWSGLDIDLSLEAEHALPNPLCFGLMANDSAMMIHSAQLRVVKDNIAYSLGEDWDNPLITVAGSPPASVAKKCLSWNGFKYFISEKSMTYPEAQQLALQLKGRMLTLTSTEEQAFLIEAAKKKALWTSAWHNPQQDSWRDDRNRPLTFFGTWGRRQPSRDNQECFIALTTAPNRNGWEDVAPAASIKEAAGSEEMMRFSSQLFACVKWGKIQQEGK